MGAPGPRRPEALRVPRPRGRAGRPVVVDGAGKREAYRRAFDRFDPARVARFRAARVAALLRDPGIIRNRAKVASAVENAKAFLDVQREHGSFDAFAWSFVGGKPIRRRPRSAPGHPGDDAGVGRLQQGAPCARLRVRGLDDLLRLHAGLRPRGRPRPGLLPGEAPLSRPRGLTRCPSRGVWHLDEAPRRPRTRQRQDVEAPVITKEMEACPNDEVSDTSPRTDT